jgi:hypothetical protein
MRTFKTRVLKFPQEKVLHCFLEADFGLAEPAEGRRKLWRKGIRNIGVDCDRGGLCWVSSRTDCVRGGQSNNSKENGDGGSRSTARQSVRQHIT